MGKVLVCLIFIVFLLIPVFDLQAEEEGKDIIVVEDIFKIATLPYDNVDFISRAEWNGEYWLIEGFENVAFGHSYLFKSFDLVEFEDLTPELNKFITDEYAIQQNAYIYGLDFDFADDVWLIMFRTSTAFERLIAYDGMNFYDKTDEFEALYPQSDEPYHKKYIENFWFIGGGKSGHFVAASHATEPVIERYTVIAQYQDKQFKDITELLPEKFTSSDSVSITINENEYWILDKLNPQKTGGRIIKYSSQAITDFTQKIGRSLPFVINRFVPGNNGDFLISGNESEDPGGEAPYTKPWLVYYKNEPVEINEVFEPREFYSSIWDLSYNKYSNSWLIFVHRGEHASRCSFQEILVDKTCPTNDKLFEIFEYSPEYGLFNLTDKISGVEKYKFARAFSNGRYWIITNAKDFAFYDGELFVEIDVPSMLSITRVEGIKWNPDEKYWLITGSIIPSGNEQGVFGFLKNILGRIANALQTEINGRAYKLVINEEEVAKQGTVIAQKPESTEEPEAGEESERPLLSQKEILYILIGIAGLILILVIILIFTLIRDKKKSHPEPPISQLSDKTEEKNKEK